MTSTRQIAALLPAALAFALLATFLPLRSADAGAWTQDEGDFYTRGEIRYATATQFFNRNNNLNDHALSGQTTFVGLQIYSEYGVLDWLTTTAATSLEYYEFTGANPEDGFSPTIGDVGARFGLYRLLGIDVPWSFETRFLYAEYPSIVLATAVGGGALLSEDLSLWLSLSVGTRLSLNGDYEHQLLSRFDVGVSVSWFSAQIGLDSAYSLGRAIRAYSQRRSFDPTWLSVSVQLGARINEMISIVVSYRVPFLGENVSQIHDVRIGIELRFSTGGASTGGPQTQPGTQTQPQTRPTR